MFGSSNRYLLIITQNYFNPGVLIHRIFHFVINKRWDHGYLTKMSSLSVKRAIKNKNLKIKELGFFDVPWFILDVYETGKYFRHLPVMSNKIKRMEVSVFENYPLFFKFIFSHHHYLLLEKKTK